MRFGCLVLDHDDTVVNSTASIHYPCFCAHLENVRPGVHYSLTDYFRKNFEPGIFSLFTDELGFSEQEMREEFAFWQSYVNGHIPSAFPGVREVLEEYRARGGVITVVSHSVSEQIRRDYRSNRLPMPELIFGWELPAEQRKPSPYALEQIMAHFGLPPEQLLMVDDLKPGYDMARSCGVPFAAAGWAYNVPEIETFMRKNSDFYLKTVEEFASLVLD